MLIYYTLEEGGKWYRWKLSRKEIGNLIKSCIQETHMYTTGSMYKAIRIGKSPMIYDFVLLKLNNQFWIRTHEF